MQESTMELLWSTSQLAGGNLAYIEDLYETYLRDPNGIPEEWRSYFEKLPRAEGAIEQDIPHGPVREHFLHLSKNQKQPSAINQNTVSSNTSAATHSLVAAVHLLLIQIFWPSASLMVDLEPTSPRIKFN